MKKVISLVVISMLLVSVISSNLAYAQPILDKFVPNRLLVKFYDNISEDQKQGLFNQNKLTVEDEISQIKVLIIKVPENAIDKVETALKHNSNVEYVERDWILEPTILPNDPEISKQWHLSKIGADNAWDFTKGNNVPIAILDTGINTSHPDISTKIQNGWNFYDNNSDYSDSCGHGTTVAGVAAAMTDNGIGIAGITWDSPIIPIKITDYTCHGYYSAMAKGITYAADNGARVANISFEIFNGYVLSNAAQYMNSKGGVVVAASGNTGTYESYSDNPYIISVGATDKYDNIASFSSFGPYVDFSAPGVAVYTTCLCSVVTVDSSGTHTSTSYYMYASGTSFASPIAAGTIALMFSANPTATPDEVYNALKTSAVDLGTVGRDDYYGIGRINVNDAINAISNTNNITTDSTNDINTNSTVADNILPIVTITSPSNSTIVSETLTVTGDASDNVGLKKIEFFVNDVTVGHSTSSPYSFSIDSLKLNKGSNIISVKAFDLNDNSASSEVIVNVQDTQLPIISINSPSPGSNVAGKKLISISASDDVGISKVEIFIDGSLKTTLTGNTYEYNWNTKSASSGIHVILAKATDSSGNSAETSISVTKR